VFVFFGLQVLPPPPPWLRVLFVRDVCPSVFFAFSDARTATPAVIGELISTMEIRGICGICRLLKFLYSLGYPTTTSLRYGETATIHTLPAEPYGFPLGLRHVLSCLFDPALFVLDLFVRNPHGVRDRLSGL